jgi:GNAT superfamily N-acetyltransferase
MCAALSAEEATGNASRFTAETFRRDGFGPQPAFACLIAEVDGQPMGYALYHDDYDTDRLCRSVYLADLYVETAARGRGIGRVLMAAVAQTGHRRDARVMMWSVLKTSTSRPPLHAGIGEEIDDQVETLAAGPPVRCLAAAAIPADGITLRTAAAADCPALARFRQHAGGRSAEQQLRRPPACRRFRHRASLHGGDRRARGARRLCPVLADLRYAMGDGGGWLSDSTCCRKLAAVASPAG